MCYFIVMFQNEYACQQFFNMCMYVAVTVCGCQLSMRVCGCQLSMHVRARQLSVRVYCQCVCMSAVNICADVWMSLRVRFSCQCVCLCECVMCVCV